MKKKYKILIVAVILITIVFSALIYTNYDLIVMVKNGITYSKDDLQKMELENEEKMQTTLNDFGIENIRPLTKEEEEKLKSGEISNEEAVNIILGKQNEDTSSKNDSASKPDVNKKEIDEKISNLIGQMYVYKSQFKGELQAIEGWVHSEYRKLTKEEKEPKLSPAEQAIAKQAYNRARSLEKECDAKVEAVLTELTQLLKQSGQDASLVTKIRESYNSEKQIMKSHYVNVISK